MPKSSRIGFANLSIEELIVECDAKSFKLQKALFKMLVDKIERVEFELDLLRQYLLA